MIKTKWKRKTIGSETNHLVDFSHELSLFGELYLSFLSAFGMFRAFIFNQNSERILEVWIWVDLSPGRQFCRLRQSEHKTHNLLEEVWGLYEIL